ncbi:hypothetical protein Rsub_08993 [Raphidocelis subcapitata]|uniref:Exocyst complex component SEC5 n=1 Tax=Raphidocelis subcapitata TaxID=307507 RepID=A0A2V0PFY6_9CHLO|nr:hypothetical protein Rsub_08993 [Raphidocelis subcapitata]|eukprot:GBF96117.1 hypothetical protein Rsub_08993 [Raphidocelis subcapitata]
MPPGGGDDNPFRRRADEEDGSEASFLTDDEGDAVGEEGGGAAAAARRTGPSGPATWQEVDRAELSASALALISSIAQTAPADDRSRDAVWHPTAAVTVAAELVDPLGLGRIDAARLVLERQADAGSSRVRGGASGVDTGHGQPKGAVGRFFADLAARGRRGGGPAPLRRTSGSGAGPSAAGDDMTSPLPRRRSHGGGGRSFSLPLNSLLPTAEGFEPEAYLGVFHAPTPGEELVAGRVALERGLGERAGQLKTLVKQNFDRFIGAGTAIDDIYGKLQRIESAGAGVSSAVLFNAVTEVQGAAKHAFGPLLERHAKAERIKSVLALLRRFQSLFSAPSRIRALAAAHDYEQVVAEYKKANALIRPTSSTGAGNGRVWARLHAEIESRVEEVWSQLEAEVTAPELSPAGAPDLLVAMAGLQAEGLPVAQAKDPVHLMQQAREARFRSAVAAAKEQHTRAMARLRERYCSTEGVASEKVDDAVLLAWSEPRGEAAEPAAGSSPRTALGGDAGLFGLQQQPPGLPAFLSAAPWLAPAGSSPSAAGPGGLGAPGLMSHLAPLSGLQPPPLQSRLVQHTTETPGEALLLSHLSALSAIVVECLPGFWTAASAPALLEAPELPTASRAALRKSLRSVSTAAQRLLESFCRDATSAAGALVAVGPMRTATASLVQSLASTLAGLRAAGAPPAAADALASVLRYALEAAVRALAAHLEALPAALAAREDWVVTVAAAAGEAPTTHLPEQLQEEITVAMGFFRAVTATCEHALGGALPRDTTSRPLHIAFFACLGQCTAVLGAMAERYAPGAGAAPAEGEEASSGGRGGAAGASSGSPPRGPGRPGSRLKPLLNDSDSDDDGAGAAGDGAPGPSSAGGGGVASASAGRAAPKQRGGVGLGGVSGVGDDVRLLLVASNLAAIRGRLMGSLTQRFLLLLTGEVESEVERVGRTITGLAKRMDAALQSMFGVYVGRKRAAVDRVVRAYVRPDGAGVGLPPELSDVTPGAQALLGTLAQVQAEAYAYARPYTPYLLPPALEYAASALASAYAALRPGDLPREVLAQHFLDLVWLDGVLGAGAPPSLRGDIDTGYALLAQRIAGASTASTGPSTPLGRSLAAVTDPAELNKKLQVTCRKLLPSILGRSTFTLRSFLPV